MDMNDAERARVHHCQGLLFPQSARDLCAAIGLNWWAAKKLHEEGWLSFDPNNTVSLDDKQEHELRFVGSLIAAGCDQPMLATLLAGLAKPYCYDGGKMYYDWANRLWRHLPELPTDPAPDEVFDAWLASLAEERDVSRLQELQTQVEDALRRASRNEEKPNA